jgi:hypothetical protein
MPNFKTAFLRRHGIKTPESPRTAISVTSEPVEPLVGVLSAKNAPRSVASTEVSAQYAPRDAFTAPLVSTERTLTWQQKRAQHMERRLGVTPRPSYEETEPDKEPASSLDVAISAVKETNKLGEKTWKQRRKEVYLITHSVALAPVNDDPSTFAQQFEAAVADALRSPRSKRGETVSAFANELMEAVAFSHELEAEVAARTPRGEKSWTQKRKDSFLKRYGRVQAGPPSTDVALSAISFVTALKTRTADKSLLSHGSQALREHGDGHTADACEAASASPVELISPTTRALLRARPSSPLQSPVELS